MKRWIHASDEYSIPDGYLTTTRFTAPFIQTNEQRNVLEAIEIAISQRFKQFDKMCDITEGLTSSAHWDGTVDVYPEGYYIRLEGTRSSFQAFVQNDLVIRKPRLLSDKIGSFDVEGLRGQVTKMRKN